MGKLWQGVSIVQVIVRVICTIEGVSIVQGLWAVCENISIFSGDI